MNLAVGRHNLKSRWKNLLKARISLRKWCSNSTNWKWIRTCVYIYIYMHILYTNISIIKSKGPFLLSTWQGETYPCTKSPFLSRLDDVVPRLSWDNYWQTPNPSSDTFQTRLSDQSLNPSNSHPNVVHSHVFAFFHVFWVIFSSFICFHLNKAWLQDHHVCFEGQDFGDNLQPGKHHSAQRWDVDFFWVKALAENSFSVKYCK